MPIVNIHFLEGRNDDQRRKLVDGVTKVVCESLNTTPDHVRIILSEMPFNGYAIAGELMVDKKKR